MGPATPLGAAGHGATQAPCPVMVQKQPGPHAAHKHAETLFQDSGGRGALLPTLDVAGRGRAEEAGWVEGLDGPIRPVLKPVLLLAFPAEEAGVTSLWVTEGEAQKPRRGSWNLRREATAQPRRVRLAGFGSRCPRTSLTLRASRCISVRPGAHQCVLVRPSASQSIQCPARVWDGRRGGSVRVRAVCWPGRPDADPGLPPQGCRPLLTLKAQATLP